MVITDTPNQNTPLKAGPPNPGQSSGSVPPPPPTYSAVPPESEQAFYGHVRAPRQEPAGKRFCKAFGIAVLIWLLAGAVIRSIVAVSSSHSGRWGGGYEHSDIHLQTCTGYEGSDWGTTHLNADSYPYHVSTSFKLPIDSKTLFLLARGSLSSGVVSFATSTTLKDVAQVDVTVGYYRQSALERVKICSTTRGGGENGVSLLTPRQWWGRQTYEDRVFYTIVVTLPKHSTINSFETELPNHRHEIPGLKDIITFKNIAFHATNGRVDIDSLYFTKGSISTTNAKIVVSDVLSTEDGDVKTTNQPISGYFNATDALYLTTTNGAIKARVSFTNSKSSQGQLVLKTTNNVIESTVDFASTKDAANTFDFRATSTNGRLDLTVSALPNDANLQMKATTTNARTDLKLPATFEGRYSLSTTNASPTLVGLERKDPKGKGRQRIVRQTSMTKGRLDGVAYWGDETNAIGFVGAETTNGKVTLQL